MHPLTALLRWWHAVRENKRINVINLATLVPWGDDLQYPDATSTHYHRLSLPTQTRLGHAEGLAP